MSCGDCNDFIIPKGLDFDFVVQILEEDSFLPQVLDGFVDGSFALIDTELGESIVGVNTIALSKITEDTVDAIILVEEEIELSVATSMQGLYYIDINETRYQVDYTEHGSDPTLNEVATALYGQMGVLPQNVAVTLLNNVLTIKNTIGQANTVIYSTNIAKTNYIIGVEAVDGYTKTFYNDNGYLKGTIPALETAELEVSRGGVEDSYYLKSLYQGVIQVNFSDNTLNKTGIVCKIYVVNTGN
jgi:hypothetical protein